MYKLLHELGLETLCVVLHALLEPRFSRTGARRVVPRGRSELHFLEELEKRPYSLSCSSAGGVDLWQKL
jgi:hypothetical protein